MTTPAPALDGRPAPPGGVRDLPADVRRTYVCHWVYSALSGVATGVLTNGPVVGVKALKAADWHLALPTGLSGVGLLLSVVLGVCMARRSKLPFITGPGLASSAACLAMAAAPRPLLFFAMLGLCNMLEIVTRPAMTAVIRSNYPTASRGWVTGRLRQCSAVAFLAAALGTARLLDSYGTWPVVRALISLAALLQTLAYVAFGRVRERSDPGQAGVGAVPDVLATVRTAAVALRRDARFVRYLAGCFLFAASGLAYEPLVRAYFSTDLGLNYTQCVVLADVVPSLVSVLTLHRLGAWLDRTNPLRAYAWIRVGWALDPLLLSLAPFWPAGSMLVAAVARLCRGGVMNGSWLLWWQLGTNYFAPRGELTSVYNGLHISLNGAQRICGPALGAALSGHLSRRGVLVIGGVLVLASALHAWLQAEDEKVDGRCPTFADREEAEVAADELSVS
jgi:hypothetical protein